MRFTTIFMAVMTAALLLLATDAMAKDDVYRWVDEKGVVHFGDRPPKQADAEQINIHPSAGVTAPAYASATPASTDEQQDPEPSYAQQKRDERAKLRQEAAEQKQITDAACEQRRTLVAQMEPSTRVIVEYEDGTIGRLDDNERLETLNEAKAYIAENCKEQAR